MKKNRRRNAITLIALVITIVIMLLLAAVAIQMTMGENGLIAKSKEAQKAQAKAELYDTAKLSYTNLKAKALENGEASPQAELALSTTEFTNKYNIVGDDIIDKKGNVIDTKANVLNVIQGTVAGGFSSGTTQGGTSSSESWPKTVGGVTIPEEDKDKMIFKLKVSGTGGYISFEGKEGEYDSSKNVEIDYGNGIVEMLDLSEGKYIEYNRGEYIIKIEEFSAIKLEGKYFDDYEIEVLQWGKIKENSKEHFIMRLFNVSEIYDPEPDKVIIEYYSPKLKEIPEWLFSKKVETMYISQFLGGKQLTSIPENLFKNNINLIDISNVFMGCTGLKSIPENLFKNNINLTDMSDVFNGCTGLTNISENLFKNNVKVIDCICTFSSCIRLNEYTRKFI